MTDLSPESLQSASRLRVGLGQLGLDFNLATQQRLLYFLDLLTKWNKVFNLTAVRDRQQMVSRQLLDSLSVLPMVTGHRVLDVGSGGGLPGMPLAIADPDRHYYLLDSNGKKTRFLTQVKMEMRLTNVFVVNERVEAYFPSQPFDTVVSRAFASLSDFVDGSEHLLAPDGRWLAMKGKHPVGEMTALAEKVQTELVDIKVPGEEGERCVVAMSRC
ncbi:MAG: 16S rRNA (guanine(527)-N(7))-methyltransferase RsmG [bacterium]